MMEASSSTSPGPIVEAVCWAHARRKFFDLARLKKAPIAIEAVERIDALFAIEREVNGMSPQERAHVRNERSRPLVVDLETWLRQKRAKLSAKNETAKAIQYSLKLWSPLTRFLDDGRLCVSNNAAERALRCVAVGRPTGPSPVPTTAAGAPPSSTRSSRPPSSTTSTRRRGSPTSWPACRIIRPNESTNSCRGTGNASASKRPPLNRSQLPFSHCQ
jgi:Transposase IS66 family